MATDQALAESVSARAGTESVEAVLRLYQWDSPTISFGRNEPTRGVYDPARARAAGVDLVRRPTGGRAVLHDAELTYAVVLPVRALGGARATYREINTALVHALHQLGAMVEVAAVPDGGMPGLAAGPCFQSPADGEVVASGRKLVGSAQARIGKAFLQHGSIILSGDQSLLGVIGQEADHEQPATLFEQIGPLDVGVVADHVVSAMKKVFGGTWVDGEYSGREKRMIRALVEERYASDEWTWRR